MAVFTKELLASTPEEAIHGARKIPELAGAVLSELSAKALSPGRWSVRATFSTVCLWNRLAGDDMSRFRSSCGRSISDPDPFLEVDFNFCPYCGNELAQAETDEEASP